ncbi:flagellar biosynthesis protein FlhF [Paenibacillus dakarensis]|uniref:flagellar biosynthesis protein FlhF n=1 Tax=Paenibacillus dakarensis TaxID=1527293 RepID=UPI0006D5529B|nr:flagellar biosynthesis protein FlhF [Paenibacillus dakarensis]
MRVKRYIVDTMPEAMKYIRNELGSEAVILSSKEIKTGGFLGIFTKKKIEVIAAVDKGEKKENSKPEAPVTPVTPVPRNMLTKAYKGSETAAQVQSEVKEAIPHQVSAELAIDRERAAVDFAAAYAQAASGVSEKYQDNRTEQGEDPHSDQKSWEPVVKSGSSIDDSVVASDNRSQTDRIMLEEMREMKEWIARLSRQTQVKQELPAVLESMRDRLTRQGLSDSLSEKFLTAVIEEWTQSGKTLTDEQLHQAMEEQLGLFLEGRYGGGLQRDTRIVYIAGPTGVGKTTTIAKLAAEQLFRYQRRVGFITSDTYRISAVEQLRTYASILNVPLEVVQSPGDMKRAMERLAACDLILMDTAGRNYRNELLVSELQSLLNASDQSETYLVLSLTSKSSDMLEITDHFSKFGLDKVIFTKLDETGSYGSLFNVLEAYPLKLSYMTNGQNVPDDLIMPDTAMLSRMLLGEIRT